MVNQGEVPWGADACGILQVALPISLATVVNKGTSPNTPGFAPLPIVYTQSLVFDQGERTGFLKPLLDKDLDEKIGSIKKR